MYILKKSPRTLGLDEPIRHESHKAPVSRGATSSRRASAPVRPIVAGGCAAQRCSWARRRARAMSPPLEAMRADICNISAGAGKVPFICFDLAGGANLQGSEMLIGVSGNPLNFLSTAGLRQARPAGQHDAEIRPTRPAPTNNFVNKEFGAAWHSDGAILRGMQASTQVATRANVNGFGIAARSENDTGNNPHNPMYGINRVGADGQLLTLIGSQNTDSGGNSMAPAVDDESRRASDQGRSRQRRHRPRRHGRAGHAVLQLRRCDRGARVDDAPGARQDRPRRQPSSRRAWPRAALRKLVKCGYVKSTYLADRFRTPSALNPDLDAAYRRPARGIFTQAEYDADDEFRKTAAVMKMVINGYAGAGTVTMGGYDYHGQGRNTGETRNFRAGRCIGACLEYAARMNKPLMIYVFSDGSLSANGMVEQHRRRPRQTRLGQRQPVDRRVVRAGPRPGGRVAFRNDARMQIGSMSAGGDVVTTSSPAANAVNLLVETVHPQLHGAARRGGQLPRRLFPRHGLGGTARATASPCSRRCATGRSPVQSDVLELRTTVSRERRHRCRVLPTLPRPF